MFLTYNGVEKGTLTLYYDVDQRPHSFIDNHYFHQELHRAVVPGQGYPRLYYPTLNDACNEHLRILYTMTEFRDIPMARRGQPFRSWKYIVHICLDYANSSDAESYVSRDDATRIADDWAQIVFSTNRFFITKLYLRDLGENGLAPHLTVAPLRGQELIHNNDTINFPDI